MLADLLRSLAGLRLTDEEGEEHVEEMRAALGVSIGLANGPLESFSLLDLEGFGLEEAFPHVYSIAHDGYGNYWVLDLLPEPGAWGPVFYPCHDPPVIAYQAESIEASLQDVVAMWQPGPRSGGIFFKARDPERLRAWYREHLGLAVGDWGGVQFEGRTSSDAVLGALRRKGCEVDERTESSEYGRFGWVADPEGHRLELWEPPKP